MNRRGGFDAIITNPPWDKFKPVAKEFFEKHSALVSKNNMTIHDFETERERLLDDPEIRDAWLAYLSEFPHQSTYFRTSPDYANQVSQVAGKKQSSDLNLYKLFLERCFRLLSPHGSCGMILQGGFHSDLGAKGLRQMLFEHSRVDSLFVLSNERFIFDNVHHSQKFCILTFHHGGTTREFPAAFRMNPREAVSTEDLNGFLHDAGQHVTIPVEVIQQLSPESMSVLEFRSPDEIRIAEKLYQFPRLGETRDADWNLRLCSELHMTIDSKLFKKSPGKHRLPLYEGKMINQFDSRHAEPRYWIEESDAQKAIDEAQYREHRFAFREVARSTDARTMICALLPRNVVAGHTLVLQQRKSEPSFRGLDDAETLFVIGVFNSVIADWLLRQQVSAHVSMFYVYQLPMPRLTKANHYFDEIVRRSALLSCTSDDFSDVATAAGIEAADRATDADMRIRLAAEIDAIVAHLYGVTEQELRLILASFPLMPDAAKLQVLETFRTWKPPSDDPLLKLIAAGESLRHEFKSSARWDYQRKQVNKDLELVIVKTIAALMNSEGGTLLIGVADNGTVLGLDPDYATIGKKGADAYENWLMTRLLENIGRDRTRLLHVSFRRIEGKEICRVDVERSRRPVFVRDDRGAERLYVRTGNSTRELTVSEALEYCREHFSEKAVAPEAAPVTPDTAAVPPPPGKQSQLLPPRVVEARGQPNLGSHGLFRKKTNETKPTEASPAPVADMAVEEILPVIREVVNTATPIDRDEAIREIARRLGAERTGARIRASIESALNAASRRYIIYSDSGGLRPYCRTIDQYKRDDLKNVLRSVIGRTWTDEDEAIRTAARYLGFRRTGSQIDRAFRSAINGGLRQGVLERSGRMLRSVSQS